MSNDVVSNSAFLRGLRVLELGDGLAGAAAAATLASLGATVVNVVDPTTSLRRAQPSVTVADGTTSSILSRLLDRDKHSVGAPETLEEFSLLVTEGDAYDLVVVDRVAGQPYGIESLRNVEQYVAWVDAINSGAWLTISAFGLSGPRANDYATELTLSAASSLLSSVRDPETGHPLKLAGNQALLSAAQAGALAACQAFDLAQDGHAVHLDLSAQEATIAMGPMLALAHQLLNCSSAMGAKRYGAPASFYRCLDGLIRISAMEDHQWQGVVRAMGSPSWTERFAESDSRIEFPGEIDEGIAKWTADLTKAQAEAILQEHAVPATAMYAPSEILQSPQLAHRGSLRDIRLDEDVVVRAVGRPFPDGPAAVGEGEQRRRHLRGLRVVEASHVLAVPLAGSLLGALGASVTKLEDLDRMDMYRRRGPHIDGEPGVNRAAYFSMANHSKTSLVVDLEGDTSELAQLVDDADVIIENVGARRIARFGASAAFEGRRPAQLAVSSSGFGNEGPHAHYRAYAYNLQTSCGLGYLTRNDQGTPAEIDLAWADLLSGYALATIVAAWTVGPQGNRGRVIDFAMAELIDARFNEFLAAASIDTHSDETVDRANRVSPFAPNGVYQSADGWVAISVDGDGAFAAFGAALSIDREALAKFAASSARRNGAQALDEAVGEATARATSASLVERLNGPGVLVEQLATTAGLIEDDHLEARGYFVEVNHPEWGRRRILGVPWRPEGGGAIALGHPPLFEPPVRVSSEQV
ncbi:MAG TPA: CoA transferase [Acidimicrobiales bacterium]|nr:CoA transferase [Acidimicrobiales bacterium]